MVRIFFTSIFAILILEWGFAYTSGLKIVEVMCNPVGTDSENEWVKIKNISDSEVDLSKFRIYDGNKDKPISSYNEESTILQKEEYAYIGPNPANIPGSKKFKSDISLKNTDDTVKILDESGNVLDSISYENPNGFKEGELCYKADISEEANQLENNSQSNLTQNDATDSKSAASTSDFSLKKYSVVFKTKEISPPPKIYIEKDVSDIVFSGFVYTFRFYAYDSSGKVIPANFVVYMGDGNRYNASEFSHIYKFPGTKIVKVVAKYDKMSTSDTVKIDVKKPSLKIYTLSDAIVIENNSDYPINLRGGKVVSGKGSFEFKDTTLIDSMSRIILTKTDLSIGDSAELVDALSNKLSFSKNKYISLDRFLSNEGEKVSSTSSLAKAVESSTSTSAVVPEILSGLAAANYAIKKAASLSMHSNSVENRENFLYYKKSVSSDFQKSKSSTLLNKGKEKENKNNENQESEDKENNKIDTDYEKYIKDKEDDNFNNLPMFYFVFLMLPAFSIFAFLFYVVRKNKSFDIDL